MLTARDRPSKPEAGSQAGHWEGDLIAGKNQGSVIGTLVERQTRLVRLLHLPSRDSDTPTMHFVTGWAACRPTC